MTQDKSTFRRLFEFPDRVNEVAARFTALIVALLGFTTLVTHQYYLTLFMAYGFIARVASGPRFSPLALVATKIVAKNLPKYEKLSPGPPKRFAQSIGALVTIISSISWLVFSNYWVAGTLVGVLVLFASMEAFAGICVGCKIFAFLMRANIIPKSICEECSDLSKKYPSLAH